MASFSPDAEGNPTHNGRKLIGIIGAGPAALTTAYLLCKRGRALYKGFHFDIGGHRVKVGRIQNFKSWSPEMDPDPSYPCYGLEYFCFEGDGLGTSSDEAVVELARQEFAAIGLCSTEKITDGSVVRQPKAYPSVLMNMRSMWRRCGMHTECINITTQAGAEPALASGLWQVPIRRPASAV